MNRRSYVVLAGSFLTTGCLSTGSGNSSTASESSTTGTESEETSALTTNTSDGTTSQSEGYSGFSGGIFDENADTNANPVTVPQGTPITVKLIVSNEEGTTTSYPVAVQLQQYEYTESDGEKSLEVVNRQTLTRSTLTVEDGERKSATPEVTIDKTGKNHRLMFLLYKSDVPDTLSEETAADSFVIPINITSAE